jgi:hypothetical protein
MVMSKHFYLVMTLVFASYAAASGWVSTVHLEYEQQFCQQLLEQNTHSLRSIASMKRGIAEATKLLNQQDKYITRLENRVFSLLLGLPSP